MQTSTGPCVSPSGSAQVLTNSRVPVCSGIGGGLKVGEEKAVVVAAAAVLGWRTRKGNSSDVRC